MNKPLLFSCISIFLFITTFAQPKAGFTYSFYNTCGAPEPVTFHNTSTGNITSYLWNFGDGTTSIGPSPGHTFYQAGVYIVTLVVSDNVIFDTAIQSITIKQAATVTIGKKFDTLGCGKMIITLKANSQLLDSTDPLSYKWLVQNNDYTTINFYTQTITDTIITPGLGFFDVQVSDKQGCNARAEDTSSFSVANPILPSAGAAQLVANRECDNDSGWTNYYFDNNTPDNYKDDSLVLSLKKNGNSIGTIGDGTFQVKTVATPGAGSDSAILLTNPLITNPSGYWVMNKYWIVTPTNQPSTPVGVRFYFNDQDLKDVNGSSPNHNLDFTNLIFYKTHGGNPDPTTNLEGTGYITSITYDPSGVDTTHWWDPAGFINTSNHEAEFEVGSFSGGGGGATGNGNSILPLQITSFAATYDNNKVTLQWKAAEELNVNRYEVQESANGKDFSTIGFVYKLDSKAAVNNYTFTYIENKLSKAYYRLYIIDRDGNKHTSNTITLLFDASAFNIFPNPAKSYVYLSDKSFSNKMVTVKIFDLSGKCILFNKTLDFTSLKLNVSNLSNGNYVLVITSDDLIKHSNFTIVR